MKSTLSWWMIFWCALGSACILLNIFCIYVLERSWSVCHLLVLFSLCVAQISGWLQPHKMNLSVFSFLFCGIICGVLILALLWMSGIILHFWVGCLLMTASITLEFIDLLNSLPDINLTLVSAIYQGKVSCCFRCF